MTGEASWKLSPENEIFNVLRLKSNIWKEKGGFRYFKLVQTDVNSSGDNSLLVGCIEIYGTVLEEENCPFGFIRNLGAMDLESVFDKHGENDDNSDDSVISYTNPNVLDYDDNVSECYSERSYHSMANDPQVFPMNVPGNIPSHKFPLGFSSTHRVNILSKSNSSNELKNEINHEMKNEIKNEMKNSSNNSSMKNIFDEIESIENFVEVDENENENINYENNINMKKNISEKEENSMRKKFKIERNTLSEKLNKFSGYESESKKRKNQKNENTASFFSNLITDKFSI